jgi:zinc transporter
MSEPLSPPFVHAYLLDRAGGGREIDAAAARAFEPAEGLLWLHLDVNSATGREWVFDESGIDELSADALLAGDSRPRANGRRVSSNRSAMTSTCRRRWA